MTIKEYVSAINEPFINENATDFIPNFLITEEFQTILTDTIMLKYSDLKLRVTSSENIKSICNSIYRMYAYKYEKLYKTLSLEYNPIENYSMIETNNISKTINKGEGKTTNTIDSQDETTETLNTTGSRNGTAENQVSPYETNEYKNESRTISNSNENGNENRTINNSSELTNTIIENSKTDSESENYELSRSGNIGVTTSQQMIESERKVALFSLYELVAKDIMKEICIYMGVCYEC